MHNFFIENIAIIQFIYGTSYVLIATMIIVKEKKESDFAIAKIFYLFVLYAIPHAISDYITTWSIIKNYNGILLKFGKIITYVSYIFLFEFGRRLLVILNPNLRKISYFFYPTIFSLIASLSIYSGNTMKNIDALIGYFLRFPGGVIIGLGLRGYYKKNEAKLVGLKLYKYFLICGIAIITWAFFCGLIRDKGTIFPATIINIESFFKYINIPVYVFRTICGIIVLWSMYGILTIFNWETRLRLKEAYETEKNTKDNLNNIFSNIADILIVINNDKKILYFNNAALKLLGYDYDEIIGKPFDKIISNSKFLTRSLIQLSKDNKLNIKHEETLITKNNEKLPVLMSYSSYYNKDSKSPDIIAIGKDIKERKRLEKDLQNAYKIKTKELVLRTNELEETCRTLEIEKSAHEKTADNYYETQYFLRTIMDSISDSILVINNDYTIRMANKSAQLQYDITSLDTKNLFCYDEIKSKDSFCFNKKHNCPLHIVEISHKPLTLEHKYFNEITNKEEYYEIVASPFYDNDKKFAGIIEVNRNITKRKELEKEIITISEKERQRIGQDIHDDLAQNLAAIDILVKIIYNKMKAEEHVDPEKLNEVIQIIYSTLNTSRRLAKGLSPISLESEDLTEIIRELSDETTNLFHINCTSDIDEDIFISDHLTLMQIYYIIKESISNTLKHSKSSSLYISLKLKTNNLILTIEDSGIGFNMNNLSEGLGLKIMKYRAEVINGELSIQSIKNQGTTITLFIQNFINAMEIE